MKKTFTLILFFLSQFSFSQNLVPNHSFEDTVACPNNCNQINYASGWLNFGQSPDYLNSCSSYFCSSVPLNGYGFQYPHSGNAYAGLITYFFNTINGREYIACHLNDTLIIGQKYFVCFYLSAGRDTFQFNYITCFTNNIGIRLSTVSYSQFTPDNISQVYTSSIITDTVNWVKISGSFIADSAYTYLIIGNFFDDANTQFICDTISLNRYAYYYIDDVILSDDSALCLSNTSVDFLTSENEFKIFPNPAKDLVALQGNLNQVKSVLIFNDFGQLKREISTEEVLSHKIDVSDLSQGFYFLSIITKHNKKVYPLIIIHY